MPSQGHSSYEAPIPLPQQSQNVSIMRDTPRGRGYGPPRTNKRGRGRRNQRPYPAPLANNYDYRPPYSDNYTWQTVPMRGRGRSQGRGNLTHRGAPLHTSNNYAPLQNLQEDQQYNQDHFSRSREDPLEGTSTNSRVGERLCGIRESSGPKERSPRLKKKSRQSKKKTQRGCRRGRRFQKVKTPLGPGIFNLSGTPLTTDETLVLDRSLKFAPIRNLNKFQAYINIQKYIRNLNIKKYFLSNPAQRITPQLDITSRHSNLRNRSVFNPLCSDNRHLEVFRNMVCHDLDQLKIKKARDSQAIKRGISSLEQRKD